MSRKPIVRRRERRARPRARGLPCRRREPERPSERRASFATGRPPRPHRTPSCRRRPPLGVQPFPARIDPGPDAPSTQPRRCIRAPPFPPNAAAAMSSGLPSSGIRMPHLIVFSHLRWDFVFQRPQHLLSRLARHYPRRLRRGAGARPGAARLERSAPAPESRCCARTRRSHRRASTTTSSPALEPLLAGYLAEQRSTTTSPGSTRRWRCRCSASCVPRAVVYDCMDELAAVQGAPRQMRQRETALLKMRRPRPHRRPEPVRGQARAASATCSACRAPSTPATSPPRASPDGASRCGAPSAAGRDRPAAPRLLRRHRRAARPRARRRAGRRRPGWQIVMVGPVVKIDPRRCRGGRTCTGSASSPTSCCRSWSPAGMCA